METTFIKNPEKRNLFKCINYFPPKKMAEVNNSEANIIILQAPPRSLKSSTIVPEALYYFLQPRKNIWVIAIDYNSTDRFIFGKGTVRGVDSYIREFFPWFVSRNGRHKKEHEIISESDSIIKGKSIRYPESFVAEKVDLIVCEDASSYPEKFYDENIRPRVIDSGGRIIINSPPPLHTTNWLVRLAAKKDRSGGRIDSFHWSLYDNPYLAKSEIASYEQDCPPHLRRALIEGLPPTEDSTVFGKIRDKVTGGFSEYDKSHVYQAGLDIGKVHDRTVLAISDLTAARLAFMDIFPPKFFQVDAVEARVMANLQRYGFPNCNVDVSGIGSMFMGMVNKHPFMIPFNIPNLKTRNTLIEELSICFQRGYGIPDIPYFINELENLDIVLKTGYHLYRSRSGYGDDTILATCLSIHGWANRMSGEYESTISPMAIEGLVSEDEGIGGGDLEPIVPSFIDSPIQGWGR